MGSIFVQNIFGRFWWFWKILDRADFPTYSATLYTHPKERNFTCTKLKIWYFEDFLALNLIVTFILLCKLAKTPKYVFKPTRTTLFVQNNILVGLNTFWGVLANLQRKMQVNYEIRHQKILKIPNFQLGANKIPLFGACIYCSRICWKILAVQNFSKSPKSSEKLF